VVGKKDGGGPNSLSRQTGAQQGVRKGAHEKGRKRKNPSFQVAGDAKKPPDTSEKGSREEEPFPHMVF